MPAPEEPEQSYYPGARCRLIVRLEEYNAKDVPEPPDRPVTIRRGKKDQSTTDLEVVTEGNVRRLVARGQDPTSMGSPQQQTTSSDGRSTSIDGIIPIRAVHTRNGVRTADTLTLDIKFQHLPIDPRVIRSCAVEYFLGTITPDDYQRGIEGQMRTDGMQADSAKGIPYSVIPDTWTDAAGRERSNLRFQGFADDIEVEWPDGDEPIVRLECTDNTRLLIDQDAPPKLTISPDEVIDIAIANYLSNFPQFRGLGVLYLPILTPDQIPKLADSLQRTAFRPKLGPSPSKGGDSKLSVWDYITDVAGTIGHVARFEGTNVIIQRPRTIYDSKLPLRNDDPFKGRVIGDREIVHRLYVYGRNIQEMSFKRKLNATYAPQNIEVRCYDPSRKKTLIVRYPNPKDRQSRLNPGNSADQKWRVIRITGVKDEKTLRIVAQSAYETIGRNELVARVITKNMGSFGGGNLDPDALDVLPGDPIDIEINRDPLGVNTINQDEAALKSGNNAAAFLRRLGFSDRFANAYQEAVNNIGFQTTFRLRTVSTDWSDEDGVTFDFEVVNYIAARADKELDGGQGITGEDVSVGTGDRKPVPVEDEVTRGA